MFKQLDRAKIIDKRHYKYICESIDKKIKEFPRKKQDLNELIEKILNDKSIIRDIDCRWPLNRRFLINEGYTSEQLTNERILSEKFYNALRKYIINHMTDDEKDIMNTYGVFGDLMSFYYDEEEKRESSFTKSLKNNSFILPTDYGNLPIKFDIPEKYGFDDDSIMVYDDEKNELIIFVADENKIRIEELIQLLRRQQRFIHEFQHYIDKILNNLVHESYNNNDLIEYLNSADEVKANIQMLIWTFARYIIKNYKKIIEKYDLQKPSDIYQLFQYFLNDNSRYNVIDEEDLRSFRKYEYYMTAKNKNLLYKNLYEYIKTDFNPKEKKESINQSAKNYIKKLLKLEESFYKMEK